MGSACRASRRGWAIPRAGPSWRGVGYLARRAVEAGLVGSACWAVVVGLGFSAGCAVVVGLGFSARWAVEAG
jgi:hypothetical protein